ncbi:YlbF family regulator [Enterococcus plantarum]|uniref:YlbF family regulator n=1 Tax=Enterococcus plantarum TaxID=1077675 RepID=UPI001A901D3E|nr:YlbF family regulator [Enterococcus plantarum]MBO0466890.1 YlbF family regulator [Enterococcus plantarum]
MEPSITDKEINEELTKLLTLLGEDELIQRYKELEEKVQNNEKLTGLVEQIKAAQKDAVQFAHYDKPEAEKEAIKRADELTKEFDEHPLVVAYREQLMEANDLLQHVTDMIQYRINEELEKEG